MIYFNGIEQYHPNISDNNRKNIKQKRKISVNDASYHKNPIKKIKTSEGVMILGRGIKEQCKDMVKSIYQKPFETLCIIGGTSLLIMSLPLIGIPTTVGGCALTLGFTGYVLAKGINHALDFMDNNKKGNYDIARTNLEQLGRDTFDMALSVPFAPKCIIPVKDFIKYGKISYNFELISKIQKAKFSEKYLTFLNSDKQLFKSQNYKKAVNKEIKTLTGITNQQRQDIKQQLLDFNVPLEQIGDVVMDKWAKIKGIKAKPIIDFESFSQYHEGSASATSCTITFNDYKKEIKQTLFNNIVEIKKEIIGNDYKLTYKNKKTGEIIEEFVNKNIYDDYMEYGSQYYSFTPEARRILTAVHEREHIHQYAQIIQMYGFNKYISLTPQAKIIYQQMLKDMPAIKTQAQIDKINSYIKNTNSSNFASYAKLPMEIDARNAEKLAIQHPVFKHLENVFRSIQNDKQMSIRKNILINSLLFRDANT